MSILLLRRRALRLPYSLSFASLPDGAVPGWTGTAQVSSGVASVVPTLGAELLQNTGFGSDAANWTPVNANLSSVAGGQAGNCLQIENSGGATGYAYQSGTTSAGQWLQASIYHKTGSRDGAWRLATSSAGADLYLSGNLVDASWTRYLAVVRAASASTFVRIVVLSSLIGETTLYDTASLKPLLLPSLFSGPALLLGRQDVRVSAAWTGTAGTQFGVALVDHPTAPTAGIVCYHDGTNLHLDKWTTPTTWTSLVNAAAAYGAGQTVELRRSGTTVQAFYNGVQIGGDQTVSDANILACRYATLFSTYDGNTASQFDVEAN